MISGPVSIFRTPFLRETLLAAALAIVVFPALAGALHAHPGHAGDECDFCLQLHKLVFAPAGAGPAIALAGSAAADPGARPDRPAVPPVAGDPARAPPVLS